MGLHQRGEAFAQTFDDYHKHWLKNCDFNFTEDFLAETHEIFDMVDKRIDREEQVLFPKLIEIGIFTDRSRKGDTGSLNPSV